MFKKLLMTVLSFGFAASIFAEAPKIIGYFPYWAQYSQFTAKDVRFDLVTHIHYTLFVADEAGALQPQDAGDQANFEALVKESKAHGVKILTTVGGTENAKVLAALAQNESKRASFVKNVVAFVAAKGIDGIELDWTPTDADKDAQAKLVKDLAKAFNAESPRPLLSLSVGWDDAVISRYDVTALNAADYLTVQAIDLMDASKTAVQPNTSTIVTAKALSAYEAKGVAASKLVPVVAFYGRSYSGAQGLGTEFKGPGSGNDGLLTYKDLMEKFNGTDYKVTFDDASQSEVAVSKVETISFSGIPSVKSVASLVKAKTYGGIAASDLSCDYAHWKVSLLVTIGSVLRPEIDYKKKTH